MTRGATPVLVADDNSVIRRLVAMRLRAAGYRVAEAKDGVAALVEFEREPVPVVVTDLNMPRLDGLGLLAALRRKEEPPEVILLTGTRASDVEAAVQALRLGAHDYISKAPASLDAVAHAVDRAVEKWQLRAENARLLSDLHRLSLTDGLTGVGNRRAFDEALRHEVARARRLGGDLALALLDIDHFKRVNLLVGTCPFTNCMVSLRMFLSDSDSFLNSRSREKSSRERTMYRARSVSFIDLGDQFLREVRVHGTRPVGMFPQGLPEFLHQDLIRRRYVREGIVQFVRNAREKRAE